MRALVAIALLLSGCRGSLTGIVVEVDTDLTIPAELSVLHVVVDARAIGGASQEARHSLTSATRLPFTFGIVHAGGPLGPISVEVTGERDGQRIVSRTEQAWFVEGRTTILPLALDADCVDRRCPIGTTCVAGACTPIAPRLDAGVPNGDAGAPDAGLECASGCACEQSCDERACACREGCPCALHCPADGECDEVVCEGDGTHCTVDARGASNLELRCDRGASCRIDARGASNAKKLRCDRGANCELACDGASNCELHCRGGAQCLLECGDASNCALRDCTPTSCGANRFVCGRACP